jgi:hypothetical protein
MRQGFLSLITVVLSVVLELLPRIKAIIIINKITAPTTHIHGCVYHVVVVVVVFVVLVLLLVLSCANTIACTKHKERHIKKLLKGLPVINRFMCLVFSDSNT